MKTWTLTILLAMAALLIFSAGCSEKEEVLPEIPASQPEPEPEPTPDPEPASKPMTPESDPTAGFVGFGMEDEEFPEPEEIFYTIYSFCNASTHVVGGEAGGGRINFRLQPGEKSTYTIYSIDWPGYFDGELYRISALQAMQLFYDEYDYTRYKGVFDDLIYDYTIHSASKYPGDESYWYYEEFNDKMCRWTYIFTDEDFERAKRDTKNRTSHIWWG